MGTSEKFIMNNVLTGLARAMHALGLDDVGEETKDDTSDRGGDRFYKSRVFQVSRITE